MMRRYWLPIRRWLYRHGLVNGPVKRNTHGYTLRGRICPGRPKRSFHDWKRDYEAAGRQMKFRRQQRAATAMVRGGMRARVQGS